MNISALFFFLMIRLTPRSTVTDTLFPFTTRVRSSAIGSVRGRGGDTGRVADVDEQQAALVLAMERRDVKAEMRSTCLKIGLHANFEIIECFLVCGLILPQVRTGDGNPRQNAAGSAGRKLCLEPDRKSVV